MMHEHPKPTSPKVNDTHCLQLRHKGMYVPANSDSHQDQFLDPYDATHYWCVYTQRGIGPDGEPVNRESCREGRECCEH
jgi:hypothetical protein